MTEPAARELPLRELVSRMWTFIRPDAWVLVVAIVVLVVVTLLALLAAA